MEVVGEYPGWLTPELITLIPQLSAYITAMLPPENYHGMEPHWKMGGLSCSFPVNIDAMLLFKCGRLYPLVI